MTCSRKLKVETLNKKENRVNVCCSLWGMCCKCMLQFMGYVLQVYAAVYGTCPTNVCCSLWDTSYKCMLQFMGHILQMYAAVYGTSPTNVCCSLWDMSYKCMLQFMGHVLQMFKRPSLSLVNRVFHSEQQFTTLENFGVDYHDQSNDSHSTNTSKP